MNVIVYYPMKSLVPAFMPDGCEVLAVEDEAGLMQGISQYRADAVVVFTEAFSKPVWNWLPSLAAALPDHVVTVIVPLHRDESVVNEMIEEQQLRNTYVLSAQLSFREIRARLSALLTGTAGIASIAAQSNHGKVCTLMSHGASGVTSFCVNFPVLFGKHAPDEKIAVVDMNREKPDLSWYFSLSGHQLSLYRPDLSDLDAAGRRNWLSVFKRSDSTPNVFYANAANRWKGYELVTLFEVLRTCFDRVYVDWGYCQSESEAWQQVVKVSDECMYFVRPEPPSLENAARILPKWQAAGLAPQIVISHYDPEEMSLQRVKAWIGVPVAGVIPLMDRRRAVLSMQSRSVLVEELFPPRQYVNGLKEWMRGTEKRAGVVSR